MLHTDLIKNAGLYTEREQVALQGISIDVEVLDVAADVTIKQLFKNTESVPIEAVYCFPMQESAAVCRFEATIGERRIRGIIDERDKAFEAYDDAIARGDGALLLDREKDDIFVASVGNLLPGQEIEVCIGYVCELPVADDLIHLIIPTTVSPRYVPAGYDSVKADAISPPTQKDVPYRMAIRVRVHGAQALSGISSPSHAVTIDKEVDIWTVSLNNGTTCLDRDFILDISHTEPKAPCAIIGQHANGDKAVMLRLYPEFDTEKAAGPSEVVFLLDCSGSMQGSSIRQAARVLELCLRSMSPGDYFNIVRFGSSFEPLFKKSIQYSDASFKQALHFILSIAADLGGTELVDPLSSVLKQPLVCKNGRAVFLITDGQVANEEEAIDLARRHRDTTRIFTFGIGHGASHSLVNGLARSTGGMAEFVSPGERIENKVLRQFSRFDQPCITDMRINWNGASIKQAPSVLPPLFNGDSFTVYGLIERGSPDEQGGLFGNISKAGLNIELFGKIGSADLKLAAPVIKSAAGAMIAPLWAKNAIRDLENGTESGSKQRGRKTVTIKQKIIGLSRRYQVLSSHTSFVVIETRSDAEKSTKPVQFRRIPVQLTRGWHGSARTARPIIMARADFDHSKIKHLVVDDRDPAPMLREDSLAMDNFSSFEQADGTRPSIYDLLLTQGPEGWFLLTARMGRFVDTSIDELREIAFRIEGVDSEYAKVRVFATALAILIFEQKQQASRETWARAVQKSRATLNSQAHDARLDGQPVIDRIHELFFSEQARINVTDTVCDEVAKAGE